MTRTRTRIHASSPRGWPAWCKVVDAPWLSVAALIRAGVHVDVDEKASEALGSRLAGSGQPVAAASLAGTSIRLEAPVPALVESLRLPALAYVDGRDSGLYQMPVLAAGCLLREPRIALSDAAREAIERATRPVEPLRITGEFPWTLYPFQARDAAQALRIVETIGGVLVAGDMGSGKQGITDTPVITPRGWRPMGSLRVGDRVGGVDGRFHEVTGVFPQGRRLNYDVRFTDGHSLLAGDEHLWEVHSPVMKKRGRPSKVMSTVALLESGLRDGAGNLRWYIPMCEPFQFEARDLPLDPYLLGVLLGDGGFSQATVTVTSVEPDMVQLLEQVVPAGIRVRRSDSKHIGLVGAGGVNPIRRALRDLGLLGHRAWEKFIPPEYLIGSVEQRLALLQGLLDTGGEAGKGPRQSSSIVFSSTSPRLMDGIMELVQSLGGTCRRSPSRRTTYTHKGERKLARVSWRASIQLPAELPMPPFRIERKRSASTPRTKYPPSRGIVSIEPAGYADSVCISVDAPRELYVADGYAVTHNTTISLAMAHELKAWPLLVVAPLIAFSTWQRQLGEMGRNAYLATDPVEKSFEVIREGITSGELDAVVIGYDRLHQFVDLVEQLHFASVIADEAQRVRTPGSRRSRALRALAAAIPVRIALSGTPLVNGIGDVLPIGAVVAPGEWRPRANEKDLSDMYPGDPVLSVTDHLGSMMVRRTMAQTGVELPGRSDHRVLVTLHPEQRRELEMLQEAATAQHDSGELEAEGKMHAFVKLQKMRQVVNDPITYGLRCPNPKVIMALELAERFVAQGRKGVVFCADRPVFQQLSQAFTAAGIGHVGIWGSTPPHERIALEKRFHNDPAARVVIATIQAASESVSFSPTGTFLLSLAYPWSPAARAQSFARIVRMNQKEPVDIIQLHATAPAGTLDDRMLEVLTIKEELASAVVDRTTFTDPSKVHYSMADLVYMLTGVKDESMEKREGDARRILTEEARRKQHAKDTIYARKGRNKTDASIGRDDGSTAVTLEEFHGSSGGEDEDLLAVVMSGDDVDDWQDAP